MNMTTFLPAPPRLSTKIVSAFMGFLVLALCAIGATLYLSWQLEGGSAAINEAGSIRMRSYRLALLAAQSAQPVRLEGGVSGAREAATRELRAIDAAFALLRQGDPQRPLLLPRTSAIQDSFQSVAARWKDALRPQTLALLERARAPDSTHQVLVDRFVDEVNQLVHAIERDSEQRAFWLRSSQLALVALALAGTVSIIYMMFLMIVRPVNLLSEGMRRMTERDFGVRLAVESRDEFGELAAGFNQMADRLQELYGGLETLVQKKTAELEDQNRELALLYDCAAFLQGSQPLEGTCDGFLLRIRQYFGAEGGSVRVLDSRRGNLHMVSHHGISEELVAAEHCLKVGECLCGEAAAKRVVVVHDLRKRDDAHTLQCQREGFATVSVFHIHVHQQHLGFFNLHFRNPKKFGKREEAILETLGQLLGTAIENLRLGNREREMAVSEERNLVAQGLHDSIAQGLNFLNLQVQMLDDSVKGHRIAEAEEIIPQLRAGVQESYQDVRELLTNFRSRLGEGDLLRSLETTVRKFSSQTGIAAEFSGDVDGAPIPPEQQLQVLFIVQEALSNVRKHASASRVRVSLADSRDFALTIADNGIGFDAETLLRKGEGHVGMNIMRERAQRINATLEVASVPGQGTTVVLKLPLALRRAA